MKTRSRPSANAHPVIAPATDSRSDSVNAWRASLRRLAPRAERTASSRCRTAPRAMSRLATLAQAINSTASTAPRRTHAVMRTSCIWRSRRERTFRWKAASRILLPEHQQDKPFRSRNCPGASAGPEHYPRHKCHEIMMGFSGCGKLLLGIRDRLHRLRKNSRSGRKDLPRGPQGLKPRRILNRLRHH